MGNYAADSGYFAATGVDNGPLQLLQDGVSGGNGVYGYSASSTFPSQTWQATNYWVDVVFTEGVGSDTTAPTVTGTIPADGLSNVAASSAVSASFSEPIDAATVDGSTFELRDGSSTLVPATVVYDAGSRSATLTPTAPLAFSTTYTATLKGGATDPRIKDLAGNALAADVTWSFTSEAADVTPPTVSGTTPSDGLSNVAVSSVVSASFSEPIDAATVDGSTFELRDGSSTLVPATVSYDAGSLTATLTPSVALTELTTYTATLKGGTADPRVKDTAGNALAADFSWSFTTGTGLNCPCSIWSVSDTPANPSENDPNAVELGVKFRSDVDGFVTGIRFYKGTANTGTHIGNLWSIDGTQLATATFSGESASGWQQVDFSSPVPITANTVYVAS